MFTKFIMIGLTLVSFSAFAKDQVLNCKVQDGREHKDVDTAKASITIVEGKSGGVSQENLKEGVFGCRVSYSLKGSNTLLSIKLFRQDMMVAESADLAFTANKSVNSFVQQLDLTSTNNALWASGGQAFGAGLCKCASASLVAPDAKSGQN